MGDIGRRRPPAAENADGLQTIVAVAEDQCALFAARLSEVRQVPQMMKQQQQQEDDEEEIAAACPRRHRDDCELQVAFSGPLHIVANEPAWDPREGATNGDFLGPFAYYF